MTSPNPQQENKYVYLFKMLNFPLRDQCGADYSFMGTRERMTRSGHDMYSSSHTIMNAEQNPFLVILSGTILPSFLNLPFP